MLLGLCLAAFGDLALGAALDRTTKLGRLCLDLPTDTTLALVDARRCHDDTRYRDDVATALAGQDITCVSNSRDAQLLLGPHGRHTNRVYTGDVAAKRAHATACALGTVRLAERLGVPTVRLQPGCPDFARWLSWWGSDVGWADNITEFRTHTEPVLAAARRAGVRLLLEPHPKQVVYDRASAELLFELTEDWADVLGLCVDPANLAATGHDPVDAVRGWGSRMISVHAKDVQRWRPGQPRHGAGWSRYGPQPPIRFRALGLGELDWPLIVATLQDEGFDGVLYLEHEDALLPRAHSIGRGLTLLRSLVPAGTPEGRTW
jgi:sugar phosphate isomerase/epimerase